MTKVGGGGGGCGSDRVCGCVLVLLAAAATQSWGCPSRSVLLDLAAQRFNSTAAGGAGVADPETAAITASSRGAPRGQKSVAKWKIHLLYKGQSL